MPEIELKKRMPRWTEADKAKLAEMREAGFLAAEIAWKLGRSVSSIHAQSNAMRLPVRDRKQVQSRIVDRPTIPGFGGVPAWVPESMREEYLARAKAYGEEEAASWARSEKRKSTEKSAFLFQQPSL